MKASLRLTRSRTLVGLQLALVTGVGLGAAASCGALTDLSEGAQAPDVTPAPDGAPAPEGGPSSEGGPAREAGPDHVLLRDAKEELRFDTFIPDVPLIVPCPDPASTADAAATVIYVLDGYGRLYTFDPYTYGFTVIGTIACPPSSSSAFAMAVDRNGVAYVGYYDGELFRVSTKSATCNRTTFDPGVIRGHPYGMGFLGGADAGAHDTLYVSLYLTPGDELATIDTSSFVLKRIAYVEPTIRYSDLTGTGDGRLFAFVEDGLNAFIDRIDPATASVLEHDVLAGVDQGHVWAFVFWGGAFFIFVAPGTTNTSVVQTYDPIAKVVTNVGMAPDGVFIVGAGVSTCVSTP